MLLEEARTTLENKIDKYRLILERAPDDRTVLLALAEASYRRGLRLEALQAYQRVLENESIPEAHLAMAQMYAQHGLHVEAFQELGRLLLQEPANPEAHILAVQLGEENEMPPDLQNLIDIGTSHEEISRARVRLGLHRSMLMREITELSRVAERSRSEPLAEYYVLQTRTRLSALDFALARLDTLEQAVDLKKRESERLRELELTRQRELEELQQAAGSYGEEVPAAPPEYSEAAPSEYPESLELMPRPDLVAADASYEQSSEQPEQSVESESGESVLGWAPPADHDPASVPLGESQEWAVAAMAATDYVPEEAAAPSGDSWEAPVPEAAEAELALEPDLPPAGEPWALEPEPSATELEFDLAPALELTLEPDLPALEPELADLSTFDVAEHIPAPVEHIPAPVEAIPAPVAMPLSVAPAPAAVAPPPAAVAPPPAAVAPPPAPVAPPPAAVAPPPAAVAPPPAAVAPPPAAVAPPPAAAPEAPPPVAAAARPADGPSAARLEFYSGIMAGLDSLVSTLAKTRGVTSIYVVSREGHLIGQSSKDQIGEQRISEIVVEGLLFLEGFAAAPQYWVLECNGGIVVMQTIDAGHVLVAIGQAGANFGALRYTMDKTKPSFAQLLAGAPA